MNPLVSESMISLGFTVWGVGEAPDSGSHLPPEERCGNRWGEYGLRLLGQEMTMGQELKMGQEKAVCQEMTMSQEMALAQEKAPNSGWIRAVWVHA